VLYAICKPQADKQQITDEAFGEGLAGNSIDDATGALLEALINYFPESRRRLLRKAAEKQKLIETRGISAIEKRLDDPNLVDKIVEDLERKLAVPTLSDSSSDLPASSESIGNLGIQGSEAGTALRRLLTLGAAESEKFQKVFGVATKDAQGNARDLVDILGEVAAASANMGSGDRAQAFNEVFGLMGITSASAIGKTVTDTKKLLADLKKSNGIADKTARDMDAGIGGAFRILKSSIEGVAIAIGESLDLSVTKMMNAISRALSGLIEWIGKNQEVVKKVALIVAGVVAVGAAFIGIGSAAGVAAFAVGGLASMFSLVGTAIGVLVTMIGALFTPIGLVVAAVAALGAYFIYSSGIAGEAIEYLKGVFETLKADTIKAFGAIANALAAGDITAAANVLWTYLKLQWIKGTTYLKGVWADFTSYLSDVWGDTAYAIGDVLISALSGLASVWNATLGFMADGWTILTTSVQKGWNSTIGFLKKGFIRLRELVDIAGDVSVQIGGVLINALAGVETAWVETIDYLADTWSVFVAQVKSMWNSLAVKRPPTRSCMSGQTVEPLIRQLQPMPFCHTIAAINAI
jgi:hypothetical protein